MNIAEELNMTIEKAKAGQITKNELVEFIKDFTDTRPKEDATYEEILQELYILQDDLQQIENAE